MSFIQFESGREKDRVREELREARNNLLKQAEERSKLRDERKVQKMLRGDDQWMLPSVSKKIEANEKQLKKSSKKKKEKKKKKRKSSSTSSSEEEIKKQKRKKRFSSESSSESSESENEWIEKKSSPVQKPLEREDWMSGMSIATFSNKEKETKKVEHNVASYDPKTSSRELNPFWKGGGNGMPTFQKPKSDSDDDDRGRTNVNRRRETNYRSSGWRKRRDDPSSSSRRSDSRERRMKRSESRERTRKRSESRERTRKRSESIERTRKRSESRERTRKRSESRERTRKRSNSRDRLEKRRRSTDRFRKRSSSGDRSRKHSNSRDRSREKDIRRPRRSKSQTPENLDNRKKDAKPTSAESKNETTNDQNEAKLSRIDFLTDQQMNELGAKILKAEILGNDELAKNLKEKLEKAREYRNANKGEIINKMKTAKEDHSAAEEHILLTKTNSQGVAKPLSRQTKESDLWGGRAGRKKNKKAETHVGGERVRYFADDDKYDIKQMFENEKFTTSADQDEQFANIAGKSKNPNDDLEDIFADKVRKDLSQSEIDDRDKMKAIRRHEELRRTLDSCDKCFESPKMEKQLIVSMGDQVYLSLPWHEGLQTGHCMIVPMQHVPCSTHLDEDVWNEVQDYRKAITRMFQSRKQDVIFFETVRYLHKHPHMVIHCVPNRDFELAPFYFKKAIQESEREWSTNKQLIQLNEKDIRRSVPKGLPYFWVHFGMDQGLAHVIEEQDRFPSNFAQETIGGLLNLDARLWRRPRKEPNPIPKVKQFADWWKPFEINRN